MPVGAVFFAVPMNVSFGELAALARGAARGAGLDWGLAEEAGFAALWLEQRGLPGAAVLAEALTAPGDERSALRLGPGAVEASSAFLTDEAVTGPLLLAPFVALCAARTGPARLSWPGAAFWLTPDRVRFAASDAALRTAGPTPARVERAAAATDFEGGVDPVEAALRDRARPAAADWARLQAFAGKSYAPATAQSRAAGAGAAETGED